MRALEEWKAAALQQRQPIVNVVVVPCTEEPRQLHLRSKSEPPEEMRLAAAATAAAAVAEMGGAPEKPAKLSWMPWWSRSRKNSGSNGVAKGRPTLVGSISAPPMVIIS